MSTSDEKVWQASAVQNLLRYRPSGACFARFRVGARLVWKNLKTAAFSVAKKRLPDILRDHRSKLESVAAFAVGSWRDESRVRRQISYDLVLSRIGYSVVARLEKPTNQNSARGRT
jgi:hypothetical protein